MKLDNQKIFLFSIFVSIFLWIMFYPGILSWDSLYYFQQASTGQFIDWHPPLLAFVLAFVLKMGGGLGVITFFQCFGGIFGVCQLVIEIMSLFQIRRSDIVVFGVVIVLVSPLTPFSIYLATFWKDTWFLISLIWLLVFWAKLIISTRSGFQVKNWDIAGFLFFLCLALLVRHNTYILYGASALFLIFVLGGSSINLYRKIFIITTPLFVLYMFSLFEYNYMNTEKMHIESVVYAIDLLSMVDLDNSVIQDTPYLHQYLTSDFYSDFRIGDEGTVYALSGQVLRLEFYDNPAEIQDEYIFTVLKHPLVWLEAKWIMYVDFFRVGRERYLYHDHVQQNMYGVKFSDKFAVPRDMFFNAAGFFSTNQIAKWFSYEHLVWFSVNIILILVYLVNWITKRKKSFLLLSFLFVPSLAYYFSYFLAITLSDFRFLYPATIAIQVISLSLAFGYANQWIVDRYNLSAVRPLHSTSVK